MSRSWNTEDIFRLWPLARRTLSQRLLARFLKYHRKFLGSLICSSCCALLCSSEHLRVELNHLKIGLLSRLSYPARWSPSLRSGQFSMVCYASTKGSSQRRGFVSLSKEHYNDVYWFNMPLGSLLCPSDDALLALGSVSLRSRNREVCALFRTLI